MLKFEKNRVSLHNLKTKKFKHPIPIACVKPLKESKQTVIFIFNSGIGSSIPTCLYMNNSIYDNHYFIAYEKAGHNDNKNKPSQFKKLYLNELDEVVAWTKKHLPGKQIYLLGESWGTAINFLYYKKNKNRVKGTIGWNMPFGIVNPEKKTAKQMYSIIWRELVTLLFNAECHLPLVQTSQDKFSRDPLFRRLLSFVPPSKTNTRINLSVWRYMRPSFNFIKKYGKDNNYNFLYIQSGQDVMADWKKIFKLEKSTDKNHFIRLKTGYHVLSMEPKESIVLYDYIQKFIKR